MDELSFLPHHPNIIPTPGPSRLPEFTAFIIVSLKHKQKPIISWFKEEFPLIKTHYLP